MRVVSRPEVKEADPPPVDETEVVAKTEEDSTEIYREKVHKFTPVFIPEKKEEPETEEASSNEESGEEGDDPDKKKYETSKKRMGGLASLMSGKKPAVSRSQTLTEQRAESELKNYAALSSLGRPIYTQVKKKRVYSGPSKETEITEVKDSKRVIQLHAGGTIKDVAKKLKVKVKELADKALDLNLLIKSEDYVGIKLASQLAALYGYRVEDKCL